MGAGAIFVVLFLIALFRFSYQSKIEVDLLINAHVVELNSIFKKIESSCKIAGFSEDKSYIDFLNVKEFSGSQIGSMVLVHPEKWQGPYLKESPKVQEKFYQILNTKNGYYILPGDGVKLADGKIIGKDVKIDYESDIEMMITNKDYLLFQDKPLAAKINFDEGTIQERIKQLAAIFKKINDDCKIIEFLHEKNQINFLNVEKFVGSEVGALNLAHPDKWHGPYMDYNPTYQNILYQVVKVGKKYFITPGNGVQLEDGKIVGKDILLSDKSVVDELVNKSLAIELNFAGAENTLPSDISTTVVAEGEVNE